MKKGNIHIILISLLLLISWFTSNGQQQMQLTQNYFNVMAYNPGYMGHRDAVNITGTFRNQWSGLRIPNMPTGGTDGTTGTTGTNGDNTSVEDEYTSISPNAYMISGDLPIRALRGGIGLNIVSDNIGAFKNVTVNLGYAYQKVLANGGKLGIGAQLKLDNIVLDVGALVPPVDDPLISQMEENDFMADANFGVFYSKPNSFFGGFSVYNICETKGKSTMFQEQRSFNLHGGYQFHFLSYPTIKFTPSALIKTDLASFQVDLNAMVTVKDVYWGGLNYRLNDGLGLIFGLAWKDFFASFSYDIPMSKLIRGGNFGSFEFIVGYSFKFHSNKGKKTQKNTRYL